ncbi:adiponectin receptor protein [Stylonychia lemnae]|uniref:Adiponectin receptor protein n=1 Tax=Stylonychia lemnae TaxID=5949 RepID=A0A078AB42_STYLE|nr:adiponectin receptor protein [Stylonychia lemnae]|eukprot:CDW79096.1 adiponectin receptor protein [Stylonychia lemnae]
MDQRHPQQSQLPQKNIFRKCKQSRKKRSHKRKCMNKKQMRAKFEETKKMVIDAFIGEVTHAPEHLVDNEYIQNGYRIGYNKQFWTIARSLFQVHNESVNVWSHLLGMVLFALLIINALYTLTCFKDMGESVWMKGINRAHHEKQHIAQIFKSELDILGNEICQIQDFKGVEITQCSPKQQIHQDISNIKDADKELSNSKQNIQIENWSEVMMQPLHRIEGLALSFVSEFQNLTHYIQEGEYSLEQKLLEWKDHVNHYPSELRKRISDIQNLMKTQLELTEDEEFIANITYSRVKYITFIIFKQLSYLDRLMDDFQRRMGKIHSDTIDRIDQMSWLDFANLVQPIDDFDYYLNYVSKWPLFVHMFTAALCLGFSAIFHLFYVYSQDVNEILIKLDYSGITLLIFGSAVPSIEYVYACSSVQHMKQFFMSLSMIVSVITFVVTMLPVFSKPQYKWVRSSLFTLLGLSVAFPLIYVKFNLQLIPLLIFYSQEGQMIDDFVDQYVATALIYLIGAVLYATKVPERCKPGAFDMCGHSHQLFHICVVIACFIHYCQNLMLFYRRQHFTCSVV